MKFSFTQKDFVEQDIQPSKNAVIGSDFSLSWNEFELEVNKLCAYFEDNNLLNLEHPVIVYGHKSANMIVAFYALMKMEISYIPVDVIYPKDRIEKIINTSGTELFINTTEEQYNFEQGIEILLGKDIQSVSNKSLTLSEKKSNDPLVYTIFTSGSTGEPKGVQISTRAVQSFVRWMTSDFGFKAEDVFINTAILSFDLSVFEVMTFGALGSTILLNSSEVTSDPKKLIENIANHKGSIWVSTPSFCLIYSRLGDEPKLNSINTFLFCGEVLPNPLAKALLNNFQQARVINTYGPTEATVATTIVEITPEIVEKYNPLPVGASKRESELLIEDGEIVIVGPNVSIGYVKNPELNARKFVTRNNQPAFKTGDQGTLKGEMLFFSGRNDDLVKLHGYRIELAEITSALNDLDEIVHGETIALKRNGDVKKIVSIAQVKSPDSFDQSLIKQALKKSLPHYMIPSDIKLVERIPLNQNGKADKKRLELIYLGKE